MELFNKVGTMLSDSISGQSALSGQTSKLYVGGLSYEVDDESLKGAFSKFGDVVFVKVIRDFHSGRSKGFGFVQFQNEESAKAALSAMNGQELNGRNIQVSYAQDSAESGGTMLSHSISGQSALGGQTSKLYVGGLSYEVDDESLRGAFTKFGDVVFVKVIRDFHSGRSKGFGFVEFQNEESAKAALSAMNGHELDGKNIQVSYAQDTTESGGEK